MVQGVKIIPSSRDTCASKQTAICTLVYSVYPVVSYNNLGAILLHVPNLLSVEIETQSQEAHACEGL